MTQPDPDDPAQNPAHNSGLRQIAAAQAALTDPELGQVMILSPEVTFAVLADAMARLGWTLQDQPQTPAPLLAGEPQVAVWNMAEGRPFVVYSFNPVVGLRVLDVGTLPPTLRQRLWRALPFLSLHDLVQDLSSDGHKPVLRAAWALVEREEVGAVPHMQAILPALPTLLQQELLLAIDRLQSIDAARISVMGGMRMVLPAARQVLTEMTRDRSFAMRLLASPADCATLFTEDVAPRIAAALALSPLTIGTGLVGLPPPEQDISAAPAGLLRSANPLSRSFPQGYRATAGWMLPDRVWFTWTMSASGQPPVRYDGLVFLGDRWLWFPRAFRWIEAALGQGNRAPAAPGP